MKQLETPAECKETFKSLEFMGTMLSITVVINSHSATLDWLLRSYSGSQAVIIMEIAAPNGAVVRKTASSVSPHAEFAKALHTRIA